MNPEVISVSQCIGLINLTLGEAIPRVAVEGEVASFKVWQNRYIYFDVKDDTATLNCFLPAYLLKAPVEDGMRVVVTGTPKLTDKGRFSLTVRTIEPVGEGAIRRAYELLKAKLETEGLFAPERKRALPAYPARVGLITAAGSAAYADFLKIVGQRWPALVIEFAPVQVQGRGAVEQVVAAVERFNRAAQPVEVMVIIRGGGSLEDLQAFNSETVARAIAASRIPTLVGVGHEVDTSLADLVADVRAATPTDAAQRLVYDRRELLAGLVSLQTAIVRNVELQLVRHGQRLDHSANAFDRVIRRQLAELDRLQRLVWRALERRLQQAGRRLDHQQQLLAAINPRAILARGYAIVRSDGQVVRRPLALPAGAPLVIELEQAIVEATVNEVHHGKDQSH